jgi:flagellar hook-basal body complex protein FliE
MKLGEVLSSVGTLNPQNLIGKLDKSSAIQGESFADALKSAMGDVNTQQVQAYDAMQGIATGKVENLQDAVRQIEEAELSLKLGLEVKNKALGAYKQVMAMQI